MIDYDLDKAHPDYQKLIPELINQVIERYPQIPLKKVTIFDARNKSCWWCNRSLGNADEKGIIKFNAYWFTQPAKVLQQAALDDYVQFVNGQAILWHGIFGLSEPDHLAAHECGHCLAQVVKDAAKWAKDKWLEATYNVNLAPSGYAVASGSEFFAEYFAMIYLGFGTKEQERDFENLINEIA
jgi:hypothetical protein